MKEELGTWSLVLPRGLGECVGEPPSTPVLSLHVFSLLWSTTGFEKAPLV